MKILKTVETLELTPERKKNIETKTMRFRRRADIILQEEMGDRKNALLLELAMDSRSYTDHKIVHVGALTIPPRESEDEVIPNILYILGHETQHVLSTNDKWWKWAHKTGVMELCKRFSTKLEGLGKRRFIKPQDVDTFIADMKARGYRIDKKYLEKILHGVVNSCEDGRIERIRAKKDFIFRKLRKATRGREWLYHPVAPFDPAKLEADDILKIVLNQVLSLATTRLYQRDFLLYASEDMEEKTLTLMPHIKAAVGSAGTEKCMKESLEIVYKLADMILAAMQKPTSDDPFSSPNVEPPTSEDPSDGIDDDGNPKSSYPNNTRTEEKEEPSEGEEGEGDDIFGDSDLDDDRKEKSTKDSGDGEDETDGDGEYDKSTGGDEGDDENAGGTGDDGDEDSNADGLDGNKTGKDGKDKGGEGKPGKNKNEGSDGDSAGGGKKGNDGEEKSGAGHKPTDPWKGERGESTGCDDVSEDEIEKIKDEIRKAMEEAAKLANGEVEISEAMETSGTKPGIEETPNTDKEPDTRSADEAAMENGEKVTLIENTRTYELLDDMPANLELEANHFREQIDELFRNKIKPDIRDRKTGRMDSSRITKLAMHQIDIYKKPRIADEFDGVAYFLCDNSGSMGYGYQSKRWYANYALAIIEEGFKSHVPLKIVAFDASGANCVQHEVIKGFSEKTNANCSYNFCVRGRDGWGNKDGYSIRVATSELLARPENKKILFVLSDGAPSDYRGGFSMGTKDVHDAVEAARSLGIEVCAIYFDEDLSQSAIDTFARMYERNYIATEPENVPDELVRLMHSWVM